MRASQEVFKKKKLCFHMFEVHPYLNNRLCPIGVHPPPKQWESWDIRRLEPKQYKIAEDSKTKAAKSLLDNSNKEGKLPNS